VAIAEETRLANRANHASKEKEKEQEGSPSHHGGRGGYTRHDSYDDSYCESHLDDHYTSQGEDLDNAKQGLGGVSHDVVLCRIERKEDKKLNEIASEEGSYSRQMQDTDADTTQHESGVDGDISFRNKLYRDSQTSDFTELLSPIPSSQNAGLVQLQMRRSGESCRPHPDLTVDVMNSPESNTSDSDSVFNKTRHTWTSLKDMKTSFAKSFNPNYDSKPDTPETSLSTAGIFLEDSGTPSTRKKLVSALKRTEGDTHQNPSELPAKSSRAASWMGKLKIPRIGHVESAKSSGNKTRDRIRNNDEAWRRGSVDDLVGKNKSAPLDAVTLSSAIAVGYHHPDELLTMPWSSTPSCKLARDYSTQKFSSSERLARIDSLASHDKGKAVEELETSSNRKTWTAGMENTEEVPLWSPSEVPVKAKKRSHATPRMGRLRSMSESNEVISETEKNTSSRQRTKDKCKTKDEARQARRRGSAEHVIRSKTGPIDSSTPTSTISVGYHHPDELLTMPWTSTTSYELARSYTTKPPSSTNRTSKRSSALMISQSNSGSLEERVDVLEVQQGKILSVLERMEYKLDNMKG